MVLIHGRLLPPGGGARALQSSSQHIRCLPQEEEQNPKHTTNVSNVYFLKGTSAALYKYNFIKHEPETMTNVQKASKETDEP